MQFNIAAYHAQVTRPRLRTSKNSRRKKKIKVTGITQMIQFLIQISLSYAEVCVCLLFRFVLNNLRHCDKPHAPANPVGICYTVYVWL